MDKLGIDLIYTEPVMIKNMGMSDYIFGGDDFSLVTQMNGTLLGFGKNSLHILSTDDESIRHEPTIIRNLNHISHIAIGGKLQQYHILFNNATTLYGFGIYIFFN